VSGTIAEVNDALADAPERLNEDPYGEGWLFTITMSEPAEAEALLDAAAYLALIAD
jgi:glycine cleavage system H protein